MSVKTRNMLYIVFVVVSLVVIFILSASYLAIARGTQPHASRVAQDESRLTRNGEPAAADHTPSTHGSRHSM